MKIFKLLKEQSPNWVSIQKVEKSLIWITAQPPYEDGSLTRTYNLILKVEDGKKISVQENDTGSIERLLPICCPCRHINSGGVFCLGIDRGVSVLDKTSARHWWKHLELYLKCQEAALQTQIWPPKYEVGHGDSGKFQVEAESCAKLIGDNFGDDYASIIALRQDFFVDKTILLNKCSVNNEYIISNLNSDCPLKCKDKISKPIIMLNCDKLDVWQKLIRLEMLRRDSLDEFVKAPDVSCSKKDMIYCEFKNTPN